MSCVQCRRLELELDRAERRYSLAVDELATDATTLSERVRLQISVTSARMYVQMAEIEIERHQTVAHRDMSVWPSGTKIRFVAGS